MCVHTIYCQAMSMKIICQYLIIICICQYFIGGFLFKTPISCCPDFFLQVKVDQVPKQIKPLNIPRFSIS